MKKKCIICDTDGTIAKLGPRRDHLLTKNWKRFFDDMHQDEVWEHTRIVMESLRAQGYAIVVVTARPDDHDYREKTINWYAEHGIDYDAIYMRKGGDYRKDSIVKEEILFQMIEDGWDPVMALDDRTQVCDLWRSHGIPTLQVNEDDTGDNTKASKFAKPFEGQILLHMMVGPSGAGKSTYIEKNYKPTDVVSSDAVRDILFGGHEDGRGHTPEDLARTWSYVHAMVKARLDHGVFTVLDSTSIRDRDRKRVLQLLPVGVLAKYIVIDRNYDDKLKTRGWRPESLIDKHHKVFKSNIKAILAGDRHPYVIVDDKREHKI